MTNGTRRAPPLGVVGAAEPREGKGKLPVHSHEDAPPTEWAAGASGEGSMCEGVRFPAVLVRRRAGLDASETEAEAGVDAEAGCRSGAGQDAGDGGAASRLAASPRTPSSWRLVPRASIEVSTRRAISRWCSDFLWCIAMGGDL